MSPQRENPDASLGPRGQVRDRSSRKNAWLRRRMGCERCPRCCRGAHPSRAGLRLRARRNYDLLRWYALTSQERQARDNLHESGLYSSHPTFSAFIGHALPGSRTGNVLRENTRAIATGLGFSVGIMNDIRLNS